MEAASDQLEEGEGLGVVVDFMKDGTSGMKGIARNTLAFVEGCNADH